MHSKNEKINDYTNDEVKKAINIITTEIGKFSKKNTKILMI